MALDVQGSPEGEARLADVGGHHASLQLEVHDDLLAALHGVVEGLSLLLGLQGAIERGLQARAPLAADALECAKSLLLYTTPCWSHHFLSYSSVVFHFANLEPKEPDFNTQRFAP